MAQSSKWSFGSFRSRWRQAPIPTSTRLYYGAEGVGRVRYDNERGEGDHRHSGAAEEAYDFTSIDRLLDDFERDIANWSD